MKRVLIAAGAIALLAGRAAAWEVKDNPDRFISVGIHSRVDHLIGNSSTVENPGPNETLHVADVGQVVNAAGLDVRIPLCPQITFTAGYDKLTSNRFDERTGNTYRTFDGIHGNRVELGMRFYFVK